MNGKDENSMKNVKVILWGLGAMGGGIGKMLDMIPGLGAGKISEDDIAKGEKEFKQMEAIIYSMTPAERKNPSP